MAQVRIPANSYSHSKLKVIHYGLGSIDKLPETIQSLGVTRALILTSKSVAKLSIFKDASKALGSAHVASFANISEHTPVAGIKAALEVIKENNADGIVAVGGGSSIDAAKAVSYYRNESTRAGFLKIVAVPTTLSAAECTMVAGYTNEEGQKVAVVDLELCPDAIILDGNLTTHTPARLWLSTGIRALDHAVETIYSTPLAPFIVIESALSSIPQLFENLIKSHDDPNDIEARQRLQLAAYLSLTPYPKPGALGLSHALGHKLGAPYHIPHGITSCLTLAKVVGLKAHTLDPYSRANLARATKRLETEVGDLLPRVFVENEPKSNNEGVVLSKYIEALVERLGLSTTLEEWKVPKSDLEGIAKMMEKGGLAGIEGQPSVAQIHELLKSI